MVQFDLYEVLRRTHRRFLRQDNERIINFMNWAESLYIGSVHGYTFIIEYGFECNVLIRFKIAAISIH